MRSGEERWSSSLQMGLLKRRGAAPRPAPAPGPSGVAPRAPPGVPAAAAAAEMTRGRGDPGGSFPLKKKTRA